MSASSISTRDPATMTADHRRDELAAILARGLVRAVRLTRASIAAQKDLSASLEHPEAASLSVAPRPAGERAGLRREDR